jgi:glutathione S-transferase
MALRLFVVHGSHPCAAVEKAMQMKGLAYRVWEWPPPMQAPAQQLMFGSRTVPALRNGAERLSGSTRIFHRLDELAPEPRLFPLDPEARARVEAAERWGDEEFQQDGRDLIWVAMQARPDAIISYSVHSRLPLPAPVTRRSAPVIARLAAKLNSTDAAKARRRIAELPAKLDKIDGWIADGVIGNAAAPNAADLQILSTVRLLTTMRDLEPIIGGRRCAAAAYALWPQWDGEMPVGALPAAV